MERHQKHFVIIAGEASGDLHASHLVNEIKLADPLISFSGLGGPKMKESGVSILYDMTQIAVVGFWEVLKNYPKFKSIFNAILKHIKQTQPSCVVLVDYPGFNLRLAKKIKKLNIPVIYFISPQVWAWKKNRIKTIKETVHRMLVLFSFEKKFYVPYGVDARFVGHPLLDSLTVNKSKEEVLKECGFEDFKMTIGLLPGSREKEVDRHLPIMMDAARILHKQFPMIQFLVVQANSVPEKIFNKHLKKVNFPIKAIAGNSYDTINACDLCMVASGTATIETAILGKPMVVIYKTSWITWVLAKIFVKIPNIGMVNVVAGKRIVPECVQNNASGEKIAKELSTIITDEIKISEMKQELMNVKRSLGTPGACGRAADEILLSIQ